MKLQIKDLSEVLVEERINWPVISINRFVVRKNLPLRAFREHTGSGHSPTYKYHILYLFT